MSCRIVGEMMSSRLDARLDSARLTEMDRHLERCVACRKRWEVFRLMSTRFESASDVLPPPEFTANFLARLGSAPVLSPTKSPQWVLPSVVGGLSGALTLLVLLLASISLWSAFSHPGLAGKVISGAKLLTTVLSATTKAFWFGLSSLDGAGIILALISGSIGLILVLLWARLVRQWWQLGVDV